MPCVPEREERMCRREDEAEISPRLEETERWESSSGGGRCSLPEGSRSPAQVALRETLPKASQPHPCPGSDVKATKPLTDVSMRRPTFKCGPRTSNGLPKGHPQCLALRATPGPQATLEDGEDVRESIMPELT